MVPAERFIQAIKYVDSFNRRDGGHLVQVVNVSMGWSFAKKYHQIHCGTTQQTTYSIDPAVWANGTAQADTAYGDLFKPTRALYVFAAGNDGHRLESDGGETVLNLPQMAVWRAIPDRTLLVGNATDTSLNSPSSHYGSAVELWAPGTEWSVPSSQARVTGTSYAAPVVSGAALMLAAHNSGFVGNPAALKSALVNTATSTVTVSCAAAGESFSGQPLLNVRALLDAGP